jgi:TatD DNase family protein
VIDTHAHLDALTDPAVALQRARAAGVDRVVAIGSGLAAADLARDLASRTPGVYVAAGVHPHQAADGEDPRAVVGTDSVAVGEIGLDFFRDYAPRDVQRRLFAEQLELAAELERPVIIHTRAADEETAAMLERFDGEVVLHCFSSPSLLAVALERDYYVSFAGNVTYPKADDLRAAAAEVPAERILAETDSPYLAPQPVRGNRNEPAYLVHTVATLADVRGDDPAALAAQIDRNATRVFSLR